jgi:hypothetical protein
MSKDYLLVGIVGRKEVAGFEDINELLETD